MFKYIPRQTKSNSVNQPEDRAAKTIAPDLQKLVDSAAMKQEQIPSESKPHIPTPSDWEWFRMERYKRLCAFDQSNLIGKSLTTEQQNEIFRYRQELIDLTIKLPSHWTREDIVWPKQPGV